MPNFETLVQQIDQYKSELETLRQQLYENQQQLKLVEQQMAQQQRMELINRDDSLETELTNTRTSLTGSINEGETNIGIIEATLDDALTELATVDPTILIQNLDDRIPFLLLPMQVETRYMKVRSTREIERPVVQISGPVITISEFFVDATRVIEDLQDGNIPRISVEPLDNMIQGVIDSNETLQDIEALDDFEAQRLQDTVDQFSETLNGLENTVQEQNNKTRSTIELVNERSEQIVEQNQLLAENVGGIQSVTGLLPGLVSADIIDEANSQLANLETVLQDANNLQYVDLSGITQAQARVIATFDTVSVTLALVSDLVSGTQLSGFVDSQHRISEEVNTFIQTAKDTIAATSENGEEINRRIDDLNREYTRFTDSVSTAIAVDAGGGTIIIEEITDELWVRLYPDDVAIDDHEPALTQEEYDAGINYWNTLWDAEGDKEVELGLWRSLVQDYGSPRAAWIVKTLTPANYNIVIPNLVVTRQITDVTTTVDTFNVLIDQSGAEPFVVEQVGGQLVSQVNDLNSTVKTINRMLPTQVSLIEQAADELSQTTVSTLDIAAELSADSALQATLTTLGNTLQNEVNTLTEFVNTVEVVEIIDQTTYTVPPEFPQDVTIKADSWSQAATTRVLPDRFVVSLYKNGNKIHEVVGAPIPETLVVSIHPDDDESYFDTNAQGDIVFNPNIRWMYDFEEAVKVGMAVRIAITPQEADPDNTNSGFDKLVALGTKTSTTGSSAQNAVESLLDSHHYTGTGLSILPHGTPSNNTEKKKSGYESIERDAERSFLVERAGAQYVYTDDVLNKTDGHRLSDALGVTPGLFQNIAHSPGLDTRNAVAMNMALWQGTMGYFLEEMFSELITAHEIRDLRKFFVANIRGGGSLPSIRVDDQPYGILTTTAFSRLTLNNFSNAPSGMTVAEKNFLEKVRTTVIDILGPQWKKLVDLKVKNIDSNTLTSGQDSMAQALLFEILGLHPSSEEFYQRYSTAQGYAGNLQQILDNANQSASGSTSWSISEWLDLHNDFQNLFSPILNSGGPYIDNRIFNNAFLKKERLLSGQLIDGFPLSEMRWVNNTNNIPTNENYIDYLFRSKLDKIKQDMDTGNEPSNSIFYLFLRYCQFIQYWDAAMEILIQDGSLEAETTAGTGDRKGYRYFDGAGDNGVPPRSKWYFLFSEMVGMRGQRGDILTMANYLESENVRKYYTATASLREFKKAFSILRELPTAKLERLFAEHLDTCSYRLDSWYLGLTNKHLDNIRSNESHREGLYLGAFGYLENITPGPKRLDDQGSEVIFNYGEGDILPVTEDETNQGYIHGPSLSHAITAAILRNGYLSNATPGDPDRLAVDISSERVRRTFFYIEGIRSGQPLNALLGYRFERALRDKAPTSYAIQLFIFELRKKFPLVANRIKSTEDNNRPVENMAADSVVDGVLLSEAYEQINAPFTSPNDLSLPQLDTHPEKTNIKALIIQETKQLLSDMDALADLTTAESIFQLSRGNTDQANAIMSAISDIKNPIPQPEIIQTPRSGTGLTNRVTVNFTPYNKLELAGITGVANPWTNIPLTPKALADLSLNKWIGEVLAPDPTRVGCVVEYYPETDQGNTTLTDVLLSDLLIQPIDLLFLLQQTLPDSDEGELAKLITYYVKQKTQLDSGYIFCVRFRERGSSWNADMANFYELQPLAGYLYKIVHGGRPLKPGDLALPGTTSEGGAINTDEMHARIKSPLAPRPTPASAVLQSTVSLSQLDDDGNQVPIPAPSPPPPAKYAPTAGAYDALENIMLRLQYHVPRLQSASPPAGTFDEVRSLLMEAAAFGIPEAIPISVFGETDEDKNALLDQTNSLDGIANERLTRLREMEVVYDFTTDQSEEQRRRILQEAAHVLFNGSVPLVPLFTLREPMLVQDAYNRRDTILPAGDPHAVDKWTRGAARVRKKMAEYEGSSTLYDLFGHAPAGGYRHFDFSIVQLSSVPIDHWVGFEYGINDIPESDVLCLMMAVPSDYSAAAGPESTVQAGLLIDEWVEFIPNREETTGVAIHYNRPDAKPPQNLLLAVSPRVTGNWNWDHLQETILETIELAKMRAVEPDHFSDTDFNYHNLFSQLFPTLLSEVIKNNESISNDLATNIASQITF